MARTYGRVLLVVSLAALIATPGTCEPVPVQATLDGRPMALGSPVWLVDGVHLLAPAVPYLRLLGARVEWEPALDVVIARRGDQTLRMVMDQDEVILNGRSHRIADAPRIIEGTPCVPLRYPARRFGFRTAWDPATRIAEVETPDTVRMTESLFPRGHAAMVEFQGLPDGSLFAFLGEYADNFDPPFRGSTYLTSRNGGKTWTQWRHRVPSEMLSNYAEGGWHMGADHILLWGDYVNPERERATAFPVWFRSKTMDWEPGWVPEEPGVILLRVEQLRVADPRAEVLYADGIAGAPRNQNSTTNRRIWRSTDSGMSWKALFRAPEQPYWGWLLEVSDDGVAWAKDHQRNLLRIERDGSVRNLPVPPGCMEVAALWYLPGNVLRAHAMQYDHPTSGPTNFRHKLFTSYDRGESWVDGPDLAVWPKTMKWLTENFGMYAYPHPGADGDFDLAWTNDGGDIWHKELVLGRRFIGLHVVSSTEAYVLACEAGRGGSTQLVHWELVW